MLAIMFCNIILQCPSDLPFNVASFDLYNGLDNTLLGGKIYPKQIIYFGVCL